MISKAALISLIGFLLSGPVAVVIVMIFYPQPTWQSAQLFAENYHPMQHLPYFMGYILVPGMLFLVVSHYIRYESKTSDMKIRLVMAVVLCSVFASLILFNYITQTTFIHHLAAHYQPAYDSLISGFSMANPLSMGWAIEMWGYAVLGASLYMLKDCYRTHAVIRWLLLINLILSVLAAVWAVADAQWLLKPIGLFLYAQWNVLMIILLILINRHHRLKKLKNQPVHYQTQSL